MGVFINALDKKYITHISPETHKTISEQCNILKEAVHKAEKYDEIQKDCNTDLEHLKSEYDKEIGNRHKKSMK